MWEKADAEGLSFDGRDRNMGAERFGAIHSDLVVGADAQLRSTADVQAGSDWPARFVRDFVGAWDGVMLDRYDVKGTEATPPWQPDPSRLPLRGRRPAGSERGSSTCRRPLSRFGRQTCQAGAPTGAAS